MQACPCYIGGKKGFILRLEKLATGSGRIRHADVVAGSCGDFLNLDLALQATGILKRCRASV